MCMDLVPSPHGFLSSKHVQRSHCLLMTCSGTKAVIMVQRRSCRWNCTCEKHHLPSSTHARIPSSLEQGHQVHRRIWHLRGNSDRFPDFYRTMPSDPFPSHPWIANLWHKKSNAFIQFNLFILEERVPYAASTVFGKGSSTCSIIQQHPAVFFLSFSVRISTPIRKFGGDGFSCFFPMISAPLFNLCWDTGSRASSTLKH